MREEHVKSIMKLRQSLAKAVSEKVVESINIEREKLKMEVGNYTRFECVFGSSQLVSSVISHLSLSFRV